MKKVVTTVAALVAGTMAFAISYKNNTYQKLADEYAKKAQTALDYGEYEKAEEYAQKAEENAALSEAYVKKMLARADAEEAMNKASKRIAYAKTIDADKNFPMAFSSAQEAYASAETDFAKEDYASATVYANKVLEALADIREVTPLPKYYVVRPWADTKDCYWNISGRHYVYNNPLLWENLYQANKTKMPRPNDPNLIHPGMKMEIPSITGEYRDGVYSPSKSYDAYSAAKSAPKPAPAPVVETVKTEETPVKEASAVEEKTVAPVEEQSVETAEKEAPASLLDSTSKEAEKETEVPKVSTAPSTATKSSTIDAK